MQFATAITVRMITAFGTAAVWNAPPPSILVNHYITTIKPGQYTSVCVWNEIVATVCMCHCDGNLFLFLASQQHKALCPYQMMWFKFNGGAEAATSIGGGKLERFCRWAADRKHIKACVAQFLRAFDKSKPASEQHQSHQLLDRIGLSALDISSASICAAPHFVFRARFGICFVRLLLFVCLFVFVFILSLNDFHSVNCVDVWIIVTHCKGI